jgi:hypothetical protein
MDNVHSGFQTGYGLEGWVLMNSDTARNISSDYCYQWKRVVPVSLYDCMERSETESEQGNLFRKGTVYVFTQSDTAVV